MQGCGIMDTSGVESSSRPYGGRYVQGRYSSLEHHRNDEVGQYNHSWRGSGRENDFRTSRDLRYGNRRESTNGDRRSVGSARSGYKRERRYPMRLDELERLLHLPPDVVVTELLRDGSGFHLLLKEFAINDDEFALLINVLAHATSTQSNKQNLCDLFSKTCEQKFIDKLCSFIYTIKKRYLNQAQEWFSDLHTFLETYANTMTTNAIDRLPNLLEACIMLLTPLKDEGLIKEKLVKQYEALQEMLTKASKQWRQEQLAGGQNKRLRKYDMDRAEPPDDFREYPVLPTPWDLLTIERPFLRRNIVKGKYNDVEHYLDVQFRLLREDFVRPLRNGIQDYMSGKQSKIRDVRIYKDVCVVGSQIKNYDIIHNVQLNMPKRAKMENSKRLLYGNLVCFSNDDFKTLLLACISVRDPEELRDGIIGVQFESDIENFDLSTKFLMVESKAYFMPYKHVLMALKNMSGNAFPLDTYIVNVDPDVKPPEYLNEVEMYDLRVIKNSKMMKKSEAYNTLFDFDIDFEEPDDTQYSNLKEVPVKDNLTSWPSEIDLGLDSSQQRALQSALTRQLAIIHGPPGTGKTFIGLKIAQILLHNSNVWKNKENPTPILVVCFTNHALDQFLEGMSTYTRNIVRIGSRSKSTTIEQFQINSLLSILHENSGIPNSIHERNRELLMELNKLEDKIMRSQHNKANIISKAAKGIISLDLLLSEDIIPSHLRCQLILGDKKLADWLLFNIEQAHVENQVQQLQLVQTPKETTSLKQEDEENCEDELTEDKDWEATQELRELEEQNRLLPDFETKASKPEKILGLYIDNKFIPNTILRNEVTVDMLALKLQTVLAIYNEDVTNSEAYFKYTILAGQLEALNIGLSLTGNFEELSQLEMESQLNIWSLTFPMRWKLYNYWVGKLLDIRNSEINFLEASYQKVSEALRETRNQKYLYAMRHASVVGMTTTAAAQYNDIMKDLAPAIVIIEEAAEILESHVITSLTAKCQHLIMIGDHQQLRPSATVYELATKYGLETSLFERMIKNGLAYETLEYQHRMRPSISKLLVPSIYPNLKDHPSVNDYPSITGMSKNVFFISHDIPEREDSDDNNSHENQFEAEFIIGLCRHLVLQGYSPREITILTPYSGQFFLLRRLQDDHVHCRGVKICVVDNFQGEENNIILLSLVRSNVEGIVGFLRTDNRVCVALSRAKHGLYVTGNMDLLSASSELWKKIREDLTKEESIGNTLILKCKNHPDKLTPVSSGDDFFNKSPEGGCQQVCGSSLLFCKHSCSKICHVYDEDHIDYKCQVPCPKTLCELDHPCPKKCWEKCTPCEVPVTKLLPCGHSHSIPCHVNPNQHRCPTEVIKTIPLCQHDVKMPCHCNPRNFRCTMNCDTRLDCGHKCHQNCHRHKDPDHLNYDCLEMCTKLNAGCSQNHPCKKMCYQECGACIVKLDKTLPCGHEAKQVECSELVEDIKCRKNCQKVLRCGHPCKKLCFQTCGDCTVKVTKTVPDCNHTAMIECGLPATASKCEGKCPRKLPCGHFCTKRCMDPCIVKCIELVPSTTRCPNGHIVKLPCHLIEEVKGEAAWVYCKEPCNQLLKCEHNCMGDCGRCFQGRVHVSCQQPCKKPLVCGHICKHPCSAECPPCQEPCQWRCQHSCCRKKCGMPCELCKMNCEWECKHLKCNKLCGDKCSRKPCNQACPKKLECGHPCIGFCGDPCPPLCRVCHVDELTEFMLLGYEEEHDARFVLLEDCGHTIEVQGLEGWLGQDSAEIGMKTCPKCRKPIYNNRRYQNIILETYEAVKAVKCKYFKTQTKIKKKDIELILQDPEIADKYISEVTELYKKLGLGPKTKKHKKTFLNDGELRLIQFQAQVLKKAAGILKSLPKERDLIARTSPELRKRTKLRDFLHSIDHRSQENQSTKAPKHLPKHESRLGPMMEAIVELVMQQSSIIAPQMIDEVSCEMQRLMILPAYWTLQEKFTTNSNDSLMEIKAKLEKFMDPTIKFDSERDIKVQALLKESEKHVGVLGISQSEKIMILQAMGFRQGHWYKCPNGHIYCITECGRAMEEGQCPDCGSRIGGGSHRLRSDNAVAYEMDGAQHRGLF
ncbi:NFX1-type zinc finger-containing protein 1 [Procambarus clarkii]|uniref:NFX1-type zinc finger-containing protein 1 n=1 Tax=Procambarus clarkii TaxID=6728 RepID=UPI001E6783BC|nr:NFX1-type zinc finger-containing protein 1-like [Procambarus clarkii]